MKIIRDFGEYFKHSLCDAHINRIEHKQDNLVSYFSYIFSYDGKTEQAHKAKIIFEHTDIDGINALVFNKGWLDDFQGKCIDLETYRKKYKNYEFEVTDESHNRGKVVYQGWFWVQETPVYCIINIFSKGRMIYVIDEWIVAYQITTHRKWRTTFMV